MNFTIKTIGCKVNTYESMKIKDELIKRGFDYIDVEDKDSYASLDLYIVNTCSVTSIADKKSRKMLRLAKKYNPNVIVIAIGCMVDSLSVGTNLAVGANGTVGVNDTVGSSCASPISGVDYLFNNKDKSHLANFLLSLSGENAVDSNDVGASPYTRVRAFIKIQDGCNQYCTYCIIPFLRGNIKSRDNDDIINEVREKVKSGVKEIVLTGIHLSSFGLDRVDKTYESDGAIDIARKELLNIMSLVAEIDGVERIRLGSLEPRIIDENFLSQLVGNDILSSHVGASNVSPLQKKFCANFCLSLQSGCDKTLKRMNRHYTTADFERACNLIRKYMPYSTITTDIIVGFPGETEEDFAESMEFVKRMRFYNPNIFPYSRRKGTKADLMPDQLTNEEKHRRSTLLIAECEKITKKIEDEYNKVDHDILVEEEVIENGIKYGIGYTKEYFKRKIIL